MTKKYFWVCILIMVVLCAVTYANHFYNSFHFDDAHTIQNNSYIRDIKNIPIFFRDGRTSSSLPQNQSYRPITTTSLAFDYWLGNGYNLFLFHLSTFILFVLQGVLMVFFFNRIFNLSVSNRKMSAYAALIASTWYLLHPAIAETVNYIIARADLQSTFFVLLAFILYIYSPFCRKTYLYNVAIIIGALAKPPAVMFAPLLFLYSLFFEEKLGLSDLFKKSRLKQVLNVFKNVIPAIICCIIMYVWQAKLTPKSWEPGGTSPMLYLITQPFVILHYFQMFFVPNALSVDTDWHLLPNIWNWQFFTGILFIIIIIWVAFVTSKKAKLRPVSFGICWFFLALIPTSSVIPLAEVLNDHRMYFPFVGLSISVTWTIALLLKKYVSFFEKHLPSYKTILFVLVALILSGYAYGTYQRNEVWHTEESLWHDVTLKSPDNGRGLMNYGLAKMAEGDYTTAGIYFERALKLLPYYPNLYINMGILKAATGHPTEAENYFKTGLAYGNNLPDAYLYYGRFLSEQGRYPEATTLLKQSLTLSRGNLYAQTLLTDIYRKGGQKNTNAPASAEKCLDLSLLYYQTGKYLQCIEAALQAIQLKPDYAEAYNNIGAAYNRLKEYDKAIKALKRAIELKPDFQLAKNNLSEAQQNFSAWQSK